MCWYVAWAPTPIDSRLGEVYIDPQLKTSRWRKVPASLWHTGQSGALSGVPLAVGLTVAGDRCRVSALRRTVR
jgi:hypothetical protein